MIKANTMKQETAKNTMLSNASIKTGSDGITKNIEIDEDRSSIYE